MTALLLSCGIALEEHGLSEIGITRLRRIEELAAHIKSKLALSDEALAANADC